MNRSFWWLGMTRLAVIGAVGFAHIGVETWRTALSIQDACRATHAYS